MKIFSKFSILAISAVVFASACNKDRKEQRIADKLTGTWKVTNMILPIHKKDSSFLGKDNWINLRFDDCPAANKPACNMAFTIKHGEKSFGDIYFPMGYTLKAKNELRMVWKGDTLNFKIEEYKKKKLKLTGMDSAFANPTNYIIEAER